MTDQRSHHQKKHRRDSFRNGKRYLPNTFAQGGTKSDPLNLASVTPIPEGEVLQPITLEVREERPQKRRKVHDSEKRPRSPMTSPFKEPKPHLSKEERVEKEKNIEEKKCKRDYFNNKYCYGNFDRYYGIRLNAGERDQRLSIFKKEWFEKKSVLDIGCNVGFLTLSLAKDFVPRRILGIDIDEHLIGVARKNIRHYCDHETPILGKFPASFAQQFGNVSQHTQSETVNFGTRFPDNIWFKKENFVLEKDEMLDMIGEEFDVILALSVTKWIHLNWGDDGMRRFFKRVFKQLRPGGRFIIEPQPFDSYKKRAKMTEKLKDNYEKIEFKPTDFEMYLLEEIGFATVEHLGAPSAKSKGFERGIDMYWKSDERAPKAPQE